MSQAWARSVRTVDSHTEGNPTRVIVGGVPVPPGSTLLQQRDWLRDHDDGVPCGEPVAAAGVRVSHIL